MNNDSVVYVRKEETFCWIFSGNSADNDVRTKCLFHCIMFLYYRGARNAKKYSCKWSTKPLSSTFMDTALCWEQCHHKLYYSIQISIRYGIFYRTD